MPSKICVTLVSRMYRSSGTLYAVAPSKEQLVAAVVRASFRQAAEHVEGRLAAEADPVKRIDTGRIVAPSAVVTLQPLLAPVSPRPRSRISPHSWAASPRQLVGRAQQARNQRAIDLPAHGPRRLSHVSWMDSVN